ncbi:MAG: DUF7109 family protein [Halobacteriota archaeon]
MNRTSDDLAGVVDLFGALTREELETALGELAFKQGRDADGDALSSAVDDAVAEYALVEYERDDESLLTVGPTAFPSLPANAEDLPHIMSVPARTVDRTALARTVEKKLRSDAARAVNEGDDDRIRHLLDVTYDLETWAPVDVSEVRTRLDSVIEGQD